jgi:hypothetical protein
MDAALQTQLSIAALACSLAALCFSLLAAFPGLKVVLAAVRDGVLWLALFLIVGGAAFVAWQHVQKSPVPAAANAKLGSPSRSP